MPVVDPASQQARKTLCFGSFELDVRSGQLSKRGIRIKLQQQPIQVLIYLAERAGQVVTREELQAAIWPSDTFVDFEQGLNRSINKIRAALNDEAINPRFIETLSRKGYRFVAPASTSTGLQSIAAEESPAVALPASPPVKSKLSRGFLWTSAIAALVAVAAAGFLAWNWSNPKSEFYWRALNRFTWLTSEQHKPAGNESAPTTPASSVAVIPFWNEGAGPAFDYLRFALAEDIVTDLTYAPFVSVRPLTSTSKYVSGPRDAQTVSREMKVSYVISGDLLNDGHKLTVTVELIRASDSRLLWRESVSAAPQELMLLHRELAARVQDGLLPALGKSEQITSEIPAPHNQQAYELFMRAVAVPRDPGSNKAAIAYLNESVTHDPDYAPAWVELGWRYYLDAEYSDGGELAYWKSADANTRAQALDPNGTANSVALKTEHGDLQGAFDEAQRLLSRRPDASVSHYQAAYVYRYAGLLDQAAQECDAALTIDPGYFFLRSCSKVFMYKGDYRHAQAFVDLDGSSGWSVRQRMQFALRQKNYAEALSLAAIAVESGYNDSQIVAARLQHSPATKLDTIGTQQEAYAVKESDPEEKYEIAAMLNFAGQSDRAMRILKMAIQKNYCATPQIDVDPLLATLRTRPDFQALRNTAATCQQNFLAGVRANPHR